MLNQQNGDFNYRLYLGVLRKKIHIPLLIAMLLALFAYIVSNLVTPWFEAKTTILVNEQTTVATNEYNAILTSERLARTYSELLLARPLLETLRAEFGLGEELETLKSSIRILPIPNTQLIEIRVLNRDSELAALIANSLVEQFVIENRAMQQSRFVESKTTLEHQIAEQQQFVNQIQLALGTLDETEETQAERSRLEGLLSQYRQSYAQLLQSYEQLRLAEAQGTSNLFHVDPAIPPTSPVSPDKALNTILAGVAGLVLTIGILFLQVALDNSIKDTDDVKNALGLTVLSLIGKEEDSNSVITLTDPRSPIAEAFRSLRTSVQFSAVDNHLKTIVITSASQGEGKTTVAANLAVVMSQLGAETILIDADLRRPRQHKLFALSNKKGLSNLFVAINKEIPKAILSQLQGTKRADLKVLASGGIPPNPSELISSKRMMSILDAASEKASLVIIDAPPVLPVTDAIVLAQKADGVIVVMIPGKTTLPMAKQTIENLRRVNANILGVVFNNADLNSAYFSAYRNGYQYLYDQES